MRIAPHPASLFLPGRKHLFVFAHQDDDLSNAGILQRATADSKIVWVTNGDGLAPSAGMDPGEYAAIRENESIAALATLGYRRDSLFFLRHSELEFYKLFVDLGRFPSDSAVPRELADRATGKIRTVRDVLLPLVEDADVVWTQAWQGGHPEHDLTHFATALAVREIAARGKKEAAIPFFELPAYEMTILVPLRFPPWKRGFAHEILLTCDELARKDAAFTAYRSQQMAVSAFRKLISAYGLLSTLRGRPFSFRDFAMREQFAPVPPDRRYDQSPHRTQMLDYIFEDYKGERVTFHGSIGRMVRLLSR